MPIKIKATPAQELLKELLDFNEDTGILTWKAREPKHFNGKIKEISCKRWNAAWAGKQAGYVNQRRMYITLRQREGHFPVNRIIWVWVYGREPSLYIDHIDGDSLNNRLNNLREASVSQNMGNSRIRKDQKNGYKGIEKLRSGRYVAKIRYQGVRYQAGPYDTQKEAHAAYCEMADRLFKEFANYGTKK